MGHIINGIKDKVGLYKLDSVNCFERPVAMIYNYLRPGSDNLYLMYRKLFQSFHICNDLNFVKNTKLESEMDNCKIFYENNEDGIVKYEGGQYIFRFTTGKIYNTWLFDNCPKVLLYNGEPSQEMNIKIKQAGIFCKTWDDCKSLEIVFSDVFCEANRKL